MKVIYMAHPLGAGEDRERNRLNAIQWLAWLAEAYGVAVIADWITLAGVWAEDRRELGLQFDLALVERCDDLWLVGGRISPGMEIERQHAERLGKRIVDLTHLGYAPPRGTGTDVAPEVDPGVLSTSAQRIVSEALNSRERAVVDAAVRWCQSEGGTRAEAKAEDDLIGAFGDLEDFKLSAPVEAAERYEADPQFRQTVDILVRLADVNSFSARDLELVTLRARSRRV